MMATTVQWKDAAKELPDSDIEVLIVVDDESNKGEVWIGYHDGERWRCASGGVVGVSYFADLPEGPKS
jgi:hypothetical protein